jgi:membrane-associated phospholipid phosphatase
VQMRIKQCELYWMNKTDRPMGEASADHRVMLATTFFLAVIDSVWCISRRWTFDVRELFPSLIAVALMLLPLSFSRYRSDPKIGALCKFAALYLCFSVGAAVLSYLVVATNAPLVDNTLDHWDKVLGFDWVKFYLWVQHYPWMKHTLVIAYASVLPQMLFVLVFLSFTGRNEQLVDFTTTLTISFIITVVISGFFPAGEAAELHFAAVPTDISMHTDFAAIRGTRLSLAFVVLNVLVIVSTPTEGGHYLVDVFGGIVTVVAAIYFSKLPMVQGFGVSRRAARIYGVGSESSLPERSGS